MCKWTAKEVWPTFVRLGLPCHNYFVGFFNMSIQRRPSFLRLFRETGPRLLRSAIPTMKSTVPYCKSQTQFQSSSNTCMGILKTNSFKPLGPHVSHGAITWVVFNMQLSDFIHRCRTVRERYLYCLENFVVNFRRDLLWYGDVHPSVQVSVHPSQFSALFSYMLWHIELKFCVWLYFNAPSDQDWVLLICVNFCRSYVPFRT